MKDYVITIARGYGSGGRTIGRMLAKELGISFYDREILRMASDESGINEQLFNKMDEKLQGSLLFKFAKKEYTGEIIPPDSDDFVSNDNLFNYQSKVIRDLAESESCVIVGRCADFVLKDYKNVIRIFVHAPEEHCLDTLQELSGQSRKDLEKKMHSIDKHRAEYYTRYTGRDWKDASNYDLCINTSEMDFESTVELVKAYLGILEKRA